MHRSRCEDICKLDRQINYWPCSKDLHKLLRNIFGANLLVGNDEVGPGFVGVGSLNRISTALQKLSWLSFQRDNVGIAVDVAIGVGFVTEGHALGRGNDGTWLFSIGLLGGWILSNRGRTWLGRHCSSSGRERRKSRSSPFAGFALCVIPEHAASALIDQLIDINRKHGLWCEASEEILH